MTLQHAPPSHLDSRPCGHRWCPNWDGGRLSGRPRRNKAGDDRAPLVIPPPAPEPTTGYRVLEGAIFEHLKYREAMKMGRSIGETGKKSLDARVDALIGDLLDQATLRAEQSGRRVA